jgi:glycosyltransferase involved in cell wall biosynthesis
MKRPRVCLAMMVKNEAHVVARALESARPLVDAWVVVDTGSTDATREVVARAMQGLPGKIVDRPWRNFGANRTETIELARTFAFDATGAADYALVLDADDELVHPPGAKWPLLDLAAYLLTVRDAGITYQRLHLLRLSLAWRYEGVVHEYAHSDDAGADSPGLVTGIEYVRHPDGARWKDPGKYLKDAALLLGWLAEHPDDPRAVFYLAQSYRDAGVDDEAIVHFKRRVTLGGFPEEVYVAQLWAARLRARLGAPKEEIWVEFLRAHSLRPSRHEALVDLAELCRKLGDYALAYLFACRADAMPPSGDTLFVEVAAETWRPRDERAIAAHYLGYTEEAARIDEALLADATVPETEKPRIAENLAFARRSSSPDR